MARYPQCYESITAMPGTTTEDPWPCGAATLAATGLQVQKPDFYSSLHRADRNEAGWIKSLLPIDAGWCRRLHFLALKTKNPPASRRKGSSRRWPAPKEPPSLTFANAPQKHPYIACDSCYRLPFIISKMR